MFSRTLRIGQRIGLGFALALAALVAIGLFSLRNLTVMEEGAGWVTHTLEVVSEARLLNDSLSRVESASRGYVLSGDATFKAELETQRQSAAHSLHRLQTLTIDNALQQRRLAELGGLLARRVAATEEMVQLRDVAGGRDGARARSLVQEGQEISRHFRLLTDALVTEENRLLALRQVQAANAGALTRATVVYGSLAAFAAVTLSGFFLTRSVTGQLARLRLSAARLGQGDYAHRANVTTADEVGHLGQVFNLMAAQVEERQATLAAQEWMKDGLSKFAAFFQRQRDPAAVGQTVLGELAELVHAQTSVLYRAVATDAGAMLELCASHAAARPPARIRPGEGLVGQCFLTQQRLRLEAPSDYLQITSALGQARPVAVLLQPVNFEGQTRAVIELASLQPFTALELEFVERLAASLGVVFQNIEVTGRTQELLRQAQELAAQLEAQQQALAQQNRELAAQTGQLQRSERQLQEQQVELTQTNEELEQTNEEMEQANEEMEEKTNLLANQKRELERSNQAMEQARAELQEQARQLRASSTYKSNFLATMSHELRTPLNSLLILARLLAENREANLTAKQVQFAQTIESSGADLLEMINQILDLAKIESGTVELQLDDVPPGDLQRSLEQQFRHVAEAKRLEFAVELAPGLPAVVHTDVGRLYQVLKNLLANAFKFTERGSVRVVLRPATAGWARNSPALDAAGQVIAFAVTDTGIGIPRDKQEIIFESFQQADAGTARRFGGTGLGLSISREIAAMLGGVLQLESDAGQGSTFTLFLPAALDPATVRGRALPPRPEPTALPPPAAVADEVAPDPGEFDEPEIEDDRRGIVPGDRVLLVIEDDVRFAAILVDFAREKGFKVLAARSGRRGLALAQQFQPVAVTLDLRLADADGWMVLDRLKHDDRTRHIPVHVISVQPGRSRGLRLGAVSYLQKPVTRESINEILQQTIDFIERPVKSLLVVEDDAVQRESIRELIGNGDVHTTAVGTAAEALAALEQGAFDCVVMDLMLPDRGGADLIREINRRLGRRAPPVIVYTGKELTAREETDLRSLSESIIVKDARSPERLLDETALFLHRVQARLPEAKRRLLEQVHQQDAVLTGRRVLVVDDDVRNIFALTAALEGYGMAVRFAESGQGAIDLLQADPACDVVLMDVMMPEMDGNEATRRLRAEARFAKLPIIAVTAKAMKGDRDRSIEAGASDYITKPVDIEKLASLLRVWLYR